MKSGFTAAEKKALRILAGCERGATEAALCSFAGIDRRLLDRLERIGVLRTRIEHLHHPRIDVTWYELA